MRIDAEGLDSHHSSPSSVAGPQPAVREGEPSIPLAECSRLFFGLKIGFDETFKVYSLGRLLRLETIRYAAQRGLRSYEFLGNDAPWTYFWTKSVRPMVSRAYPAPTPGLGRTGW